MSHACPGPRCGMSILDHRWCCLSCWASLPHETRQRISGRFRGSAESHAVIISEAIAELAKPRRKTTTTTTGGTA